MPASDYDPVPTRRNAFAPFSRPAWKRYAIAAAGVGVMTLFRLSLDRVIEHQGRFILFLPAVLFASWYGGFGAALFALALGAAVGDLLFTFRSQPPTPPTINDFVSLVLYLTAGLMITWVNELQRREHLRAEASRLATEQANRLLAEQHEEIAALNGHLQQAMTETYHRVKNNLQVVSALVSMQIEEGHETVPVREIERLNQHIQALAAINDLLTRQSRGKGEASSLSSEAILEKLLAMIPATIGDRHIRCDVETIPLSIAQGTSLAMLINELISNAVKHGSGTIELTLRATDDTARLEVCDDGPGFPPHFDPLLAAHTGLDLIKNISEKDLHGTVTYTNRTTGGASVLVTFPLVVPQEQRQAALAAPPR